MALTRCPYIDRESAFLRSHHEKNIEQNLLHNAHILIPGGVVYVLFHGMMYQFDDIESVIMSVKGFVNELPVSSS